MTCLLTHYIFARCKDIYLNVQCTVTKTEELIHTLFGHDLRFIFDFISNNRKKV